MKIKCIDEKGMRVKYGKWTQDKEYDVIEKNTSNIHDKAYFVADDNNVTFWVWEGRYFTEIK